MSHRANKRSFWFRGSALALGGQLTSPLSEGLEAHGACVLPPSGGFASTEVGRFNHRNIVAFDQAVSTVAGRRAEHDGRVTYDTAVTVSVEGLDILGMVTADRVVARMTSIHAEDDNDPQIVPLGSSFENLRIGGVAVAPRADPGLLRHGRYGELTKACARRFLDGEGKTVTLPDGPEPKTRPWREGEASPAFEDRLLLASLFDLGEGSAAALGAEEGIAAGRLDMPGFGTVYLGEYLVSRYARRLTMLRVELGCPIDGTIVVGYEVINGHVYP
jgi:hypothetical protein